MKTSHSKITSRFAIFVLFAMLSNLMGCEKICSLTDPDVEATVMEVNPTSVIIHIQGNFGSDRLSSTDEVGCSESCNVIACTTSSMQVNIVPFDINSPLFISYPTTDQLNQSFTFSNLMPETDYTIEFTVSACVSSVKMTVTFTTPEEPCDPPVCSEHGQFTAATCSCECEEGWTGDLCDEPILSGILPTNLVYDPNNLVINSFGSFSSVMPTVDGSTPFTFTIVDITPANTAISINASTGVIQTTDLLEFGTGRTYLIDVGVSNSAGSATFTDVYTIQVQ